ncbi:MAG TPA: hypothetical protein VMD59_07180, partial [Acidimicrobiales bacterium]|nr:hypothetical protein [Acidimicrobiales bacterium]
MPVLALVAALAPAAPASATSAWSATTVTAPSADQVTVQNLYTLSCSSAGDCVAVGTYTTPAGSTLGLLATESAGSWSSSEAPLPAGASSQQAVTLPAISCPSTTSCEAVGSYRASDGYTEGLLLADSGGTWTATKAPIPSNGASSGQYTQLFGVSCTTAGNCSAFGWYITTSGSYDDMLLTETSGTWTAVTAPMPGGLSQYGLESISCAAAGSCLVVGSYITSSGIEDGLIERESAGSWSDSTAPVPSGAASNPTIVIGDVACASTTACEAVGTYRDSSGNTDGLMLADSSGTWTAGEAPLPSGAATSGQSVELENVACPAAGSCAAAGSYADASGQTQAVLFAQSSGSWSASEAPLPSGAATTGQQAGTYSLSCPAAGSCEATGSYAASAGGSDGLLLSETSGSWSASEAPQPSGAATTDPEEGVYTVSCPASGSCGAIGTYLPAGADLYGRMVLSQSSGTWSAAAVPLPPGGSSSQSEELSALSCPASPTCVGVGTYTDSAGNADGLIVTGTPAAWTASEAPAPANSTDIDALSAISCSSMSSCVAVGGYSDTSYLYQGLLLVESAGTWTASEAPLPSGAQQLVNLGALSCASASSCVAVGSYM